MIVPPRPAADLEDRVLPSKTGSATTARTCRPLVCLHLITSNADRQAQHIAANYRQLADVLLPTAARRRSQATLCRALPRRRGWPDMTAARRAGSRVSRSDQGGCELEALRPTWAGAGGPTHRPDRRAPSGSSNTPMCRKPSRPYSAALRFAAGLDVGRYPGRIGSLERRLREHRSHAPSLESGAHPPTVRM